MFTMANIVGVSMGLLIWFLSRVFPDLNDHVWWNSWVRLAILLFVFSGGYWLRFLGEATP